MKARHQFKRRFSLQPSFFKEETTTTPTSTDTSTSNQKNKNKNEIELEKNDDTSSTQQFNELIKYKIVVMGGEKVGKSSIISQFLYNKFLIKYKRTIEEMHHGNFNINGLNIKLDILDTSGSFEFPAMRKLSIQSADGFILVYDVTNEATFEEITCLRNQIHEVKDNVNIPIVVVGNKTDLSGNREIDTATTESVVTVDWENGFVETSAKENININKIFKELFSQTTLKLNLNTEELDKKNNSCVGNSSRRQSLPLHNQSSSTSSSSMVPTNIQLQHLQQIRDRHEKRNSCILS